MDSSRGCKLHVGCGTELLPGWVNIDLREREGVVALDIRAGLPFENVEVIFAEHFIEHLTLDEGLAFLSECRKVLRPEGILRISTPNLDWVWLTQYHLPEWQHADEAIRDCFWMNKGFHGWGHRFLYNAPSLEALLRRVGFARITHETYGSSRHEILRGLERHEEYPDAGDIRHVIVLEASGTGEPAQLPALEAAKADFDSAYYS